MLEAGRSGDTGTAVSFSGSSGRSPRMGSVASGRGRLLSFAPGAFALLSRFMIGPGYLLNRVCDRQRRDDELVVPGVRLGIGDVRILVGVVRQEPDLAVLGSSNRVVDEIVARLALGKARLLLGAARVAR